ncbi:hypothetical protein NSPZN2_30571 [Nitrospira defluvii]|uniref:Uncharacterized protein n=1 Tax=Nitrospira defluvii TaxID=330214 RepID=A0ABM8RLE2_9BACT|nr:hypothetical protein NSPZN2_30571 [Nitrospira defluvii]
MGNHDEEAEKSGESVRGRYQVSMAAGCVAGECSYRGADVDVVGQPDGSRQRVPFCRRGFTGPLGSLASQ